MSDQLQQLLAENAALKAAAAAKVKAISFKVSEKQALSVYGLGRFPVTLYKGQWDRLIAAMPALQAFMAAHQGEFSTKD
jgi:hypothetical protein